MCAVTARHLCGDRTGRRSREAPGIVSLARWFERELQALGALLGTSFPPGTYQFGLLCLFFQQREWFLPFAVSHTWNGVPALTASITRITSTASSNVMGNGLPWRIVS